MSAYSDRPKEELLYPNSSIDGAVTPDSVPAVFDDLTAAERAALPARPYGLVGLTIGLKLILVGSVIICILAAALAYGLTALVLGRAPVLDYLSRLRTAAIMNDQSALQAPGIVLSLVLYAAISALVLAAARIRAGSRWRDVLGWRPWHPFHGSRAFWAVAVVTIIGSVAVDVLISRLVPQSKSWVTLPTQPVWAALFVGLAVLFAPVTEELVFRGWLYTGLRLKIGVWAGILVSAVLFALAHWESTHIYALAVFPVGIALGYIRETTGSLKASISFHAIFNTVASALLIFGF